MNEVTASGFGRLVDQNEELKSRIDQLLGSSRRIANATEQTNVSLHEHFGALLEERDRQYRQRFDAQDKAVDAALKAAREAVLKAEAAADKRFESVNEFRATLSDQATKFIPRTEVEPLIRRLDKMEGAEVGASRLRTILIALVGLAATLALVFLSFIAKR